MHIVYAEQDWKWVLRRLLTHQPKLFVDQHRRLYPLDVIHAKEASEETQRQEQDGHNCEHHDRAALLDAEVGALEGHAGFNYAGLLLLEG